MNDMTQADVVICGAGIAGISAAYHLTVKQGIKNVVLVDERPPLTLTSDKSTEAYRNWWPGPDDTMVRFMNRSIDLLQQLADESDNFFHLNQRGYVFLTADEERAKQYASTAVAIANLGAGQLRYQHTPNATDGADLITNPAQIQAHYPFISNDALAMLHPRRCGWLSAQQMGMYLLEQAKQHGAQLVNGRLTHIKTSNGRVQSVQIRQDGQTRTIETNCFVNAAGPYVRQVGQMLGVDIPVYNELHTKVAFNDTLGIIPRDAPLMIWSDPITLPWTDEERAELTEFDEMRWLLDELPPGLHFRPEGGEGAQTLLAIWTYDVKVQEPVPSPQFDTELYPDVVLRGLIRMAPDLAVYAERMSKPYVDGGYYCKTEENRLLVGPLPVDGTFIIGAMSGYGIMASMAAGDLLAIHITGGTLPDYAPAFMLSRYDDPTYRNLIPQIKSAGGQL